MNKLKTILFYFGFMIALCLVSGQTVFGQAVGDYRSNVANGTWSDRNDWQRWSGAAWATPTVGQGYPGQNSSPAAVLIRNGQTMVLDASPANAIGSLTVGEGTSGVLTIGNNGTVRTLSLNGNMAVAAGGSVAVQNSTVTHQLNIGGNLTVNGTIDLAFDANSLCNVTFNGAGTQTISGTGATAEFNTLTNSTGTTVLARNITFPNTAAGVGNITVNAGTFDLSTFTANRTAGGTAGGTVSVAAGATLRIAGTNSLPTNYNTYTLNATSTVEYYGTNQEIRDLTYGHLVLNGSGSTKDTPTGTTTTTVAGNFTLATNVTYERGGTSSTLVLNGTTNTNDGTLGSVANPFNTLTVGDAGGDALTNNGIINVSTTLNGTGTLTQGNNSTLNYGGTTIVPTLTATATGNTINYNGAGAQTVKATTYVNLTLSGGGANTTTGVTVNGTLSMEGTVTASAAPTYGGSAALRYNKTGTTGVEWVTPFSSTGGIIIDGGTITLNGAKELGTNVSLTISNGATLSTSASNYNLILGGNFTNNGGTFTAGSNTVTFTGNSSSINGTAATQTFNNIIVNLTAGQTLSVGGSTTTLNVNGTLTQTQGNFTPPATLNITGAFIHTAGTLTAGTNINIGGDWTMNGGTFTPGVNTVTFNGAGTQTIGGSGGTLGFNTLNINGSGTTVLNRVITVAGNLPVSTGNIFDLSGFTANRTAVGGTLSVAAGATLRIGGTNSLPTNYNTYTFNATSTVEYYGTNQTVSDETYGHLTLSGSDIKTTPTGTTTTTVAGNLTLASNIIYERGGTSSTLVLNGTTNVNNGTLGSVSNPFNTLTVGNGGGDVLTNNGSISISTTLNGAGTLTQGNNSTLNYSGTTIVPTLAATATGNTVNYSGGAQTAKVTTYVNLTLSGTGIKTFATTPTVNGILSLEGTATITVTAGVVTYGGNATLQYKSTNARTASAEEWITPFAATGGVIIDTTGAITLNTAKVFNLNVPLTIKSGASLLTNDLDITFGGDFINNGGTFTAGSSNITISGNGTQNIAGFTTTGTVTITKTGNNATLQNAISSGDLILNGTGGTLNLGTSLTHLVANVTMTNGTLNLGSSTINISGELSGTSTLIGNTGTINIAGDWTHSGTFTVNTSTVNYSGTSSDQIVRGGITYYNFQVSNGSTKLLQVGNLTVSNVLTLNSGVLRIGDYNLILSNTGIGAIAGSPFSASKMIQTDGTGYVQKAGVAGGTGINILYPIGLGGYYNPLDLTGGFTVTGVSTGNLQVNAFIANQGSNALGKYWTVNVNGYTGNITANLRFAYNAADVHGAQSQYDTWFYNGTSWVSAPGTHTSLGANPFGSNVAGVTAASITGRWSAGSMAPATSVSFYSYQSGNWSDATSWTSDPSGTQWINPGIPGASDNVTILNGRTITIVTPNKQVSSLTIIQGGILDITSTTGHNFGTVTGQGKIMLSSNTFPGGTFAGFVSSSGGTIEYYNLNNVSISAAQLTYNNLIISNYSSSANSAFVNNGSNPTTYTINGNFSVKNYSIGSQTVYFGNPAPSDNLINMTVYGNFSVDANCNVRVNNFATSRAIPNPNNNTTPYPVHTLSLYGDFTNNGSVRFTGLPSPLNNAYYLLAVTAYGGTNYGDVQVFFKGSTNNTLTCNGVTDFFRLIIEKGTDQTYALEVNSSNTNNFALYAPNNQGNNTFADGPEGYGYGAYYKALFIHYGTIKFNENINIPSLTEGGQDFNVIPTAGLWINGANVSTTVSGVNGTGYQAATLYGTLRISAGQFSTGDAAGIVLGTLGTPVIRIEGTGTLDASQTWTATGGANQMSYIQTGGTANFRMQGETQAGPMLNLSNVNSVFIMSGGTMNFTDNTFSGGVNTNFNIIDIQCQPGNYEVTGGTINFNLPSSGTTYTANSTIPLYNLNLSRRTGGGTVSVQWNVPALTLNVLNDLSIGSNSTLNLNTSSVNLAVGGNFVIATGGTYTPAAGTTNTTTFNGSGAQSFNNVGTITGNLSNLVITNSSVTSIIANNVTVTRDLTIDNNATLNDSGRYVYVQGNIVNRGNHIGQISTGGVTASNNNAQTIDGGGTGTFNNLIIDKTGSGVTLIGNVSIAGNLRLVNNANFNIGSKSLSLGTNANVYTALTGTAQNYNNTHMISTSGQPSDGGISKVFDASHKTFLYPIGTGTSYRPAQIQFTVDPSQYGSIAVRPVLSSHPLIQVAGKAINLYWKTTSSGLSGIQSNSINQVYYYNAADAPTPADEVNYIPARYTAPNWNAIANTAAVYETLTPREIHFDAVNYIDGEYTGGTAATFSGLTTYYSNSNNVNVTSVNGADWNAANTWCTGSHTGTPVGALADNMSNAAFIIGDGSPTIHRINISGAHQISAGNISIRSDGILDIGTTTGHNFGAVISNVLGNGMLRIRSNNYFPRGDWGDFLGTSGGTVEYYTASAVDLNLPTIYTLPGGGTANIIGYYNLNTLPYNASNIILPNINLTVFNNFSVGYSTGGGTANCITQINAGGTTRTLEVQGNINVSQFAILRFMNNTAQNVIVGNSISIASGGTFQVRNGGTAVANSLIVYKNIVNNGTFDLNPAPYYSNLTFTGTSSRSFSSTATPTLTRLYNISVDIGFSRDSLVNVNIDPTGFQVGTGGLILQNGTFRLTTNVSMNLSSGSFTIPGTACLSANGGTFNIATGVAAADLILNGRLEVFTGGVNVGPSIPSASVNAFNIVYASAGTPEIVVTGGTLSVYSQIRRGEIVTSGSLNYTQTGGTVTVGAKNASTARAAFEILNIGSKFVMSNGTLIIANHVSNTAPFDLALESDISNVTGGTIQLGLSGVTPNQTLFYFQSLNPLKNLTLEATTNTRAIQQIHALNLSGNLTIGGASSYYNANGLDVSLGGNLTNNNTEAAANGLNIGGYRTQVISQNTTFNGNGSQTIAGTASNRTNFAKVQITGNSGRTVFLNSGSGNVTVNGELTLSSGTLNDGSNIIYLLNNVTNNAVHNSPNTTGGFVFSGSAAQTVAGSGSGIFGNIEINNGGNGVNVTNNTTINGQLKFTNGYLYIDDYLLTLGVNATIAGTLNASNMILLNGASSDQGVTKIFPSGTSSFTFSIGSNGKYTPSTFNFSSNSNPSGATIKVIPVDDLHPTVNPANYTNYLNYYWTVVATGFSSSFNVTHTYTYVGTDVEGNPANIQRYNNTTAQWSTVSGSISSPTFSFTSNSLLDGSFTIGDQFADLPVLTSVQSGNWNNPATWDLSVVPNGNPVVISSGDSVALNVNGAVAASVTVNGVLDAQNTTFHSMGQVSGNGKIKLLSTGSGMFVFPAGSYDAFFANPVSSVEFYGSTNGTLPLDVGSVTKPYQHVIFSGTGIKYISAVDMKVNGNIIFMPGGKLDNTQYNKDLYVLAQWIDSNTIVGGFNPGTGAVRFSGTTPQNITMANNSMTETFYNLAINNSAGLTIQTGNVEVNNQLILTLGHISTSVTHTLTINNTATTAIIGGSVNSFVNGPLRKRITNGSSFQFPVGDAVSSSRNRIGYVSVNSTVTSGTQIWTARFFDKNPTTDGYTTANFVSPLNWIATNEYWNVVGPSGGSANVVLMWDSHSEMSSSPTVRAQTRVAEWNTPVAAKWNSVGQTVSDFGIDSGTVATSILVGLDNHIFTIGSATSQLGTFIWAIQTGTWNTPIIWNTGYVPGPNDTVSIGNPYTVTLDIAPTISALILSNGGTLSDGGLTMNVTGNILLNGLWSGSGALNWTTNSDTLDGIGTMSGTPTLIMNGNKIIRSTTNATLSRIQIASGNTVSNNGIIQATKLIGDGISSTWVNEANSTVRIADTLLTTGTLTATANNNTVTYNGTGNQNVKLTDYFNLTMSGSRGVNSITLPSATLNVAGTFSPTATFSSGNYVKSGNTINYNGTGAQSIAAFDYNNLTISGARSGNSITFANSDTIAVAGTLSFAATSVSYIKTGSIVDFNGTGPQTIPAFNYNKLRVSGARTTNSVTLASSDTIGVADSLIFSATFSSGGYVTTGSKIAYNGTGSQTIVPFRYNNLSISGSRTTNNVLFSSSDTVKIAGTLAMSATFSSGSLVFTGSTVDYNGTGSQTIPAFNYNNLRISGSRVANNVTLAPSTIGIANNFAPAVTFSTGDYIVTSNTMNFNGAGAQTIPSFRYNNLQTATGGTKTAGGVLRVHGNLSIGASSTFDGSSTTDTVYGDWNNSGTFTPSTSKIVFAGTPPTTITGATTFNDVVANKLDSATAVTLANDMQIANLTMTKGTMQTSSNAVTITNTRTGNGIIIGTVTRTHSFALSTAYAFEGPNSTITFTAGTTPSSVTMTVAQSAPVSPSFVAVGRSVNVSMTGGSGLVSTVRLHYENSEANSLNETIMKLWRYSSSWTNIGSTSHDSVNNYIEQAGIGTVTGNWGIGSSASTKIVSDLNGGVANAGDSLLYTISITNPYNVTKSTIVVTDPLDNNLILKSGTISNSGGIVGQSNNGSGSLVGGTITWPSFSLASGASVLRTFKAHPDSLMDVSDAIDNTAQINFGGSNIENVFATITITNIANITIDTNVVSQQNPVPGDTLVYTLKYRNIGTSNATSVSLTYTIPGNTTFLTNGYGAGAGTEVNGVAKTNASDVDEVTVTGSNIGVTFSTITPGTYKQVRFKTIVN